MAGRGIDLEIRLQQTSFHVEVPASSLSSSTKLGYYRFNLCIGGHTPITILKQEISHLTGIPVIAQVIIFKDITDKDENGDVLLTYEDDGKTLDSILRKVPNLTIHGNGNNRPILSVHSLAPYTVKKSNGVLVLMSNDGEEIEGDEIEVNKTNEVNIYGKSSESSSSSDSTRKEKTSHVGGGSSASASNGQLDPSKSRIITTPNAGEAVLKTPITPAQADHSFNAIIFDVMSVSNYDIEIKSVSIGGMLGRIRIFALNSSWKLSESDNNQAHYWSHQGTIDGSKWSLLADRHYPPSWDHETEIIFDTPLRLHPR
jgi:hypothetical protein